MADETQFIMDVIIYYLYHDIVTDRSKYPKAVPFVDLPLEMIEFLIKKSQKVFDEDKSLVQFEAPVKIFGDVHGQFSDLLHMLKEMNEKNKNTTPNVPKFKFNMYWIYGAIFVVLIGVSFLNEASLSTQKISTNRFFKLYPQYQYLFLVAKLQSKTII